MNVLVSGVAGDIGLGVGRILRSVDGIGKIYGTDLHSEHPGLFVFDQCDLAVPAGDAGYFDWLRQYVEANEIDLFIPTTEAELARLVKDGINCIGGATVVKCNDLAISNSLDKYECMRFLRNNEIVVPENGLADRDLPDNYPVIIKPRFGQGSKGIKKILSHQEFSSDSATGYIWQKYLGDENEEYTCPVYRSASAGVRVLVLRRRLRDGVSHSGEVVDNPEIQKYVRSIAQVMELEGSMNVQLRLTSEGPILFEINPRISSTVVFREEMGFSDLRWWLADLCSQPIAGYSAPSAGIRFYRGTCEYVTDSMGRPR